MGTKPTKTKQKSKNNFLALDFLHYLSQILHLNRKK